MIRGWGAKHPAPSFCPCYRQRQLPRHVCYVWYVINAFALSYIELKHPCSDKCSSQATRRQSASLSSALGTRKERKILVRWVGASDIDRFEVKMFEMFRATVGGLWCTRERTGDGFWWGRWILDIILFSSASQDLPVHAITFFLFLKIVNSGEPWDQVRLPQPAWSLHEDDLLQTLDRESHRGELLMRLHFSTLPSSRWRHYFVICKWPTLDLDGC